MSNPAINLIAPVSPRGGPADSNKRKENKFYFAGLSVIAALFILLVVFLSVGSIQYGRHNLRSPLLGLVPREVDFLVYFKNTALKTKSLSAFCSDLIGAEGENCEIQRVLDLFNLQEEDLLIKRARELAWIRFQLNDQEAEILILNSKSPKNVLRNLKQRSSRQELLDQGIFIYKLNSPKSSDFPSEQNRPSVYYGSIGDCLVFARNEAVFSKIADLKKNDRRSLLRSPAFKELKAGIKPSSAVIVYLKNKGASPSLTGVSSPEQGLLELETYYSDFHDFPARQDASWLRFIPEGAVAILRTNGQGSKTFFSEEELWGGISSFLIFDQIEQVLLKYHLSLGDKIRSLAGEDWEVILSLSPKQEREITLITLRNQETESVLVELSEILKILASQESPTQKRVTLPDNSQIIEYVREPNQVFFQNQDIEGIRAKVIPLPAEAGECFIYGYLGDKLILSNSEDGFREAVLSFRDPAERDDQALVQRFFKGEEWFYFDLDRLAGLGIKDLRGESFLNFKTIQGVSKEDRKGVLVKVWLEKE